MAQALTDDPQATAAENALAARILMMWRRCW